MDVGKMTVMGPDGPVQGQSLEDPEFDLNDPKAWDGLLSGSTTASGVKLTPRTALAYPPLWRAINLISGDVGRLPLSTYRRQADGGKEVAREHPAYKLLRRKPNPVMRASAFKRTLTYHALFRGNGFAAIFRDGYGRPQEMLILDPDATALAVVEGKLWYITVIGGQTVPLRESDVFHIRGLSNNGLWGIDVFDLMREQLGLPLAAREFTARFFGQGANQSGVLMVPDTFTDDKIKNTIQMWNEHATGLTKSHRVALLRQNVKFIPTSIDPQKASTIPQLEHEVRMASAITGCPPHKLGDNSRTSYNSIEAENQSYVDDCLDPWLVEWEEEADAKLLSTWEQEDESHFHEFNRNARLRTDSTARGNFYKALREMGVLSANDILRRENMPTIGADGDIRFRPANWVPLGEPATPSGGGQAEQRALKRLVSDTLDRKADIEREKVLRAAGKESDFSAWLDAFYADHARHLLEALAGVRRVVESSQGARLKASWAKAVRRFVDQRREELRSADAAANGGDGSSHIETVVRGWSNSGLVRSLFQPRKGQAKQCRNRN